MENKKKVRVIRVDYINQLVMFIFYFDNLLIT